MHDYVLELVLRANALYRSIFQLDRDYPYCKVSFSCDSRVYECAIKYREYGYDRANARAFHLQDDNALLQNVESSFE